MPIRNQRWVSWAQLEAERKAAKSAAPVADEPADQPDLPIPAKATRRSRRNAAAAIKDATGVELALEDAGEGEPSA